VRSTAVVLSALTVLGVSIACGISPTITPSTPPSAVATDSVIPASPTPPPSPSPSVAQSRTFQCLGPPTESPKGTGPVPILSDETGLVTNCGQTDVLTELLGPISVSNPFEANAIEVVWEAVPCDDAIVFTFRQAAGRYELVGSHPDHCPPSAIHPAPLYISFSQPMPADSIQATMVAVQRTATP
jgi:hypothetical protein